MARYTDCPQILRDFLSYHETIKGQSPKTIQEYYVRPLICYNSPIYNHAFVTPVL